MIRVRPVGLCRRTRRRPFPRALRGVQTPLFTDRARLPFALAWFLGNVVGVLLPTYLVPWVSGRFSWCSRQAQTRGASMPPERPCCLRGTA
jgi:hypothetical protein